MHTEGRAAFNMASAGLQTCLKTQYKSLADTRTRQRAGWSGVRLKVRIRNILGLKSPDRF